MTNESNEETSTGSIETHLNGMKEWRNADGKHHRLDGPAIEYPGGGMDWYVNGKRHRLCAPASESFGAKLWYFEDKLHREDGPAVIKTNQMDQWYWMGDRVDEATVKALVKHKIYLCSTLNLPASDGNRLIWSPNECGSVSEWWYKNLRHRDDGPAIVFPDGDEIYYLFGKPISKSGYATRTMKVSNTLETRVSIPPTITEMMTETATTPTIEPEVKKGIAAWSDDPSELISYDDIWTPFKAILEKGYKLVRNQEWKFDYSGYDIGKMEKSLFPGMKRQFSEKFLKSEKEKNGRSLLDVVMRATFLMGIEQGRRMAYQEQHPVKELHKTLENYRERNKVARYQLARAEALLKVRDENPMASSEEIAMLSKVELEKTRQARMDEIKAEIQMDPSISCFKQRVKKKTKLSDLLLLANTLDPEIVSWDDWLMLLNEAGCSILDWKIYAKKHKFKRFISSKSNGSQ